MMIDPRFLTAFQNTKFIVSCADGEITLQVGEKNQELDDLLASFAVMNCAFVTAWSPGSVRLTDGENAARQAALIAAVRERRYPLLHGRGVGEDGKWPPEDSILIIEIKRAGAVERWETLRADRGCVSRSNCCCVESRHWRPWNKFA